MRRGRSGSKISAAPWRVRSAIRPPLSPPPWRPQVPAIDDVDHERELHLFLVAELSLERIVGVFMGMAFREPRQRLGPAQRGPLPLGIARRFAPGWQQVDALLGLAPAACFGRMHVDA